MSGVPTAPALGVDASGLMDIGGRLSCQRAEVRTLRLAQIPATTDGGTA